MVGRELDHRKLEAESGKARWTFQMRARVDASPVIAGNQVIVASTSGDLLVLALDSGEELWSFETGSSIVASPGLGGGRLIIGTADGIVYAFGGTS